MLSTVIIGVGSYAPPTLLKNEDFLAKGIDTTDEWIRSRTGIRERHITDGSESTTDLATNAARAAIANAGIETSSIELIVVATLTPERPMPSAACAIQQRLGLPGVPAMDVAAACSGFIYGLSVADGLMRARGYKTVLVIGADILSSITNWADRSTCVLFGDGAGAVILKASEEEHRGITDIVLGADGNASELLTLERGGTIFMNGKEVFKLAVTVMGNVAQSLLERNQITKDDLALVIPHQANNRIIEAIASKIDVPIERFHVNVERYGNTSAASIPIALAEAVAAGRLKRNDWLLLVAFGGGLTWGGALIRW